MHALGVHLALVVGGGNIIRGATASREGLDRVSADYMGMLAHGHQRAGAAGRAREDRRGHPGDDRHPDGVAGRAVHPAPGHPAPGEGPAHHLRRRHRQPVLLHRHRRRAPGARDRGPGDPQGHQRGRRSTPAIRARIPSATFIPELTYQEAIVKNYAVMDANAFGLCKANQLPIVVFNINQPGAITRVLQGDRVGTIVR